MADFDKTYTFSADNDADESAWTWVGPDASGLAPENTAGSWCWTNSGSTSSGTGPPSGVACAYPETSSPVSASDLFTATMNASEEVNASTYNLFVTMDNCVQGNTTATQYLDAWDGTTWNNLDSWPGDAVTTMTSRGPYNVNSYSNSDFKLRVRVVAASSGNVYQSDLAFDTVRIYGDFATIREQHSFRFKNDTGGETSTDWAAALNTNINLAKETNIRPRVLGNYTGSATEAGTLQVKEDSDPDDDDHWDTV